MYNYNRIYRYHTTLYSILSYIIVCNSGWVKATLGPHSAHTVAMENNRILPPLQQFKQAFM